MYLYVIEEYYESNQHQKIISTHNSLNVQSALVVLLLLVVVIVVAILGNSSCLF